MSDEHPLPWAVVELSDEEYGIVDANGILVSGIESVIKCCRGFDAGRAAHCLIVRAVNAHGDLISALREIAKGEGPYSRDPLKHADNCIENMKAVANAALAKAEEKP